MSHELSIKYATVRFESKQNEHWDTVPYVFINKIISKMKKILYDIHFGTTSSIKIIMAVKCL